MTPGRRLRFAILVMATQLLLMGLAIAWCVHMVLIAKYGGVYFVEAKPTILYGEIAATVLIALFAATIFALQWKRLNETRRGDDRGKGAQS